MLSAPKASPLLFMWVFYLFTALLVWQSLVSLKGGIRYLNYVRREMSKAVPDFTPPVSVIAPCRGLDQGLRDNIESLFNQHYPAYEIIFVSDRSDDPALAVVEDVCRAHTGAGGPKTRIVIAGEAAESGQKVHNLRAAVREAGASSDVLVFVDTDARPAPHWLRSLVAPLNDKQVGAATGYRWFIPVRGGISSHLRSVWNASIASALGEWGGKNFCWGGSTAIRRQTFQELNILEQWRGTLSDDFALMRALRNAKLPIYFVPKCLTPSLEDCHFRELLEFTTRQLKITRVYARHFWQAGLMGSLLFVLVFFGGLTLVLARMAFGFSYATPLALILIIFALGTAKSYLRLRAVSLPLAPYRAELRRGIFAHLFLWPLTSALYLYNALASAFSRRIEWRGITYELRSPTETVILLRYVKR